MTKHSRQASNSSWTNSSAKSHKSSFWSKICNIILTFRSKPDFARQTAENYSNSTLSDESVKTVDAVDDQSSTSRRHRKQLVNPIEIAAAPMLIPPFSPTYCKNNEFPYSNFYVKLPDGRWMIRYRDGNRDILRTDFMEGHMI